MKGSLWSLASVVLALGALGVLGGTAIGGLVGTFSAGYGLLFMLAALYMIAGLALRDRIRRRNTAAAPQAEPGQVGGLRVF